MLTRLMQKPIEIPEGSLYRFPIRLPEAQAPSQSGFAPAAVLELQIGDLAVHTADAIVVPCGGQVDFAVRRAAGPGLSAAFKRTVASLPYSSFAPGQAVITPGFALPARHVIHCLPPLYHAQPEIAHDTLLECYRVCLKLARDAGLESVAFPALATGMRAFPPDEAAEVAIAGVARELAIHGWPLCARFVLVDSAMLDLHLAAAGMHFQRSPHLSGS